MHTELLRGVIPLVELAVAATALCVFLALPLFRTYPDDRGDGNTVVLLPPPRLPAAWRAPLFLVAFVLTFTVANSVKGPFAPSTLYAKAVGGLASFVVSAPSEVHGYMAHFDLGMRLLSVGSMIALAVASRGTTGRRGLMVIQAGLYIATMLFVDALLLAVAVLTGLPIGPTTLLGNLAALGVAFVAMGRLLFANYCLPRPLKIPCAPRPRQMQTTTLVGVTVAAVALTGSGMLWLYHAADPHLRELLVVTLPVPFAQGALALRSLLLAAVLKISNPAPPAGRDTPPIDIIVAAHDEAALIAESLQAMDIAALHYGGPVTVIVADDGSTDGTRDIVRNEIGRFQAARGVLVEASRGGKSASLNAALVRTSAEIVVRVDADTLIGARSLCNVPRWFEDPVVGLVEAMTFPRWPKRFTVFPRLRLFEELVLFGLNHRTLQVVDGINVVPGVFTAFRRRVAVGLDGFTVGMNGEDGDFTLRVTRLGYRTVFDPEIEVLEDVPPTFAEIREQRVRWMRGTMHNHARQGPYRAGFGPPAIWFTQTRQFFNRLFAPIALMLPVYLLLVAAFEGTYRNLVLLFFGIWVVSSIWFAALEFVLAFGYRKLRYIGWILLWPLWRICIRLFSTEAWLSLPARPAALGRPAPSLVTEFVVH